MRFFQICCGVSLLALLLGGGYQAYRAFEMTGEAAAAVDQAQRIETEKQAIESARREEDARIDKLRRESVPFAEAELGILEQDLKDTEVLESEYQRAYEDDKKWTSRHERLSAQHAELLKTKTELERQISSIETFLRQSYKSADVEHRLRFERERINIRRMKQRIEQLNERIEKLEKAIGTTSPSGDGSGD